AERPVRCRRTERGRGRAAELEGEAAEVTLGGQRVALRVDELDLDAEGAGLGVDGPRIARSRGGKQRQERGERQPGGATGSRGLEQSHHSSSSSCGVVYAAQPRRRER